METFQCAHKAVNGGGGDGVGGTKYHCWDGLHPSEFLNHQSKEVGFVLFITITCRLSGRV